MKQTTDLVKVIALFAQFPVNEIDKAYNERLQIWLYKNSHEQEPLTEDKDGIKRFKFDVNGNITNVSFSGKTKNGFDLLEQDFINETLKKIKSVNVQNLDLDKQKYIEFLKSYFENKRPTPKSLGKPKNYKTQYHVVSYILDCYANNKQLPTGKGWEKAGEARRKFTKAGNTFFKEANKIKDKALTKSQLINLIGDDWKTIVLELSDDPKILKPYLEHRYK